MILDGNNKPKSSLKLAVGQSSPKKIKILKYLKKFNAAISEKIIASIDVNQYYAHTS
jgi:hypothetical protein